ncbi:MAG: hypothetical protein RIB47_11980 [Cyclobacteriaceae bacterium]
MFVAFDQISDSSRVWVYQLDRVLSEEEVKIVHDTLRAFCDQWSAHGSPLVSSYAIEEDQFLILAVDENASNASGCSIDGSVRVLKDLGQKMKIDFLSREIPFQIGGEVKLYPMAALKDLFHAGALNGNSITFNNLVASKGEWKTGWRIAVHSSWMRKYLPKSTLA